jgi:hypothetical protein
VDVRARDNVRIRADHQEILASCKTLVPGAGWQYGDIACFQHKLAATRPAELHLAMATSDTEHFMDA